VLSRVQAVSLLLSAEQNEIVYQEGKRKQRQRSKKRGKKLMWNEINNEIMNERKVQEKERILINTELRLQSKKSVEAGGKLSLAYTSTLKMEATCSSETLGSLRTTGHYKSVSHTLLSHCCENLFLFQN
jgi:hypothetical protein